MRRRTIERPAPDVDLPEPLRRCVVEDWAEQAERRKNPARAMVTAWRRWREARADWARRHGVAVADVDRASPVTAPRWSVDR